MLKGIPKVLNGALLNILCDMGHGDDIAIVDANYPAYRYGQQVIQLPGVDVCTVLRAIMEVFPLDHIVEQPAYVLALEKKDIENGMSRPEIWEEFQKILSNTCEKTIVLGEYSRQDFYEKSARAYAIIQTGEERLYGDIIIKKGIIK